MELKAYIWRLPDKRSVLTIIGVHLVLSACFGVAFETSKSVGFSFISDAALGDNLLLLLTVILFTECSVFLAKRLKILCFLPLAVFTVTLLFGKNSLFVDLFGPPNGLDGIGLYNLYRMPVDLTFCMLQIILPLTAMVVSLFCYLDKIPSFVGGILFSISAGVYFVYDFVWMLRSNADNFFWSYTNWWQIAAFLGFALCLFAFRMRADCQPASSAQGSEPVGSGKRMRDAAERS